MKIFIIVLVNVFFLLILSDLIMDILIPFFDWKKNPKPYRGFIYDIEQNKSVDLMKIETRILMMLEQNSFSKYHNIYCISGHTFLETPQKRKIIFKNDDESGKLLIALVGLNNNDKNFIQFFQPTIFCHSKTNNHRIKNNQIILFNDHPSNSFILNITSPILFVYMRSGAG